MIFLDIQTVQYGLVKIKKKCDDTRKYPKDFPYYIIKKIYKHKITELYIV